MTALLDASSAIILFKANLHLIVCEMYNVVISTSVYDEITVNSYPGAVAYQKLVAESKITIRTPFIDTLRTAETYGLQALDKGEREIIELYDSGNGDFVITDDGAAAKYCMHEQVRFINALLIPKIIRYSSKHSELYCRAALNEVISIGRYSQRVINFAEECEKEELSFFLP